MVRARRRLPGGAAPRDARERRREERIRTAEVRRLACSDQLKEIVHRCIGERRKRYESAAELIEALGSPPATLHPARSARSGASTSPSRAS